MLISSLHLRKLTAFSWKSNSYPAYKMFEKKLENVIGWLTGTRGSYDLVIVIFRSELYIYLRPGISSVCPCCSIYESQPS